MITNSLNGNCPGFGQASLTFWPMATIGPITWSWGELISSATLSRSKPIIGQESQPIACAAQVLL
ncbi:MAG: hypothetical protein MGG11_18160 [Trichodesmium sp. MAG_R03]|nr:hypothetical protein [Trichodesmium sp. MAG_R03]